MNPVELGGQLETFLSGLTAWAAVAFPNFVSALILLAGGWWLAGRAERAMRRILYRQSRIDSMLSSVLASVVRYTILIVILVAVLGQLGIQTTSILAALGAAGLAIGLAMQGTLSNIAAGVMLLWLRPFRVDDYVDTGEVAGTVKELGLFATELHTWDGVYQFVPNSHLWNKRIINHTRLPTRLVDLKFGVGYRDDLAKGQQVLLELANADPRTRREPAPYVFVDELGDSAVVLRLRCMVGNEDYWPARRALTEQGKRVLEAAGLSIPFPQRDVHVRNEERPAGGERTAARAA